MVTSDLQRLADARTAYDVLAGRIAAAEPWSLAAAFGAEPEAQWGPREVLAHIVEMLPFWLGELERVVDGNGVAPVPFGRTADDPLRIGLIAREWTLPLRVLFARIDRGIADWQVRLGTLTDVELAKTGVHPRLGPLTVAAIPGRFVIDHAEEHLAQLESILADRGR